MCLRRQYPYSVSLVPCTERLSRSETLDAGDFSCLPHGFHIEAFIFLLDLQYFQDIQQIIQGIGPVPELMLLPETGGNRKKQDFIHIHASCRDEAGDPG